MQKLEETKKTEVGEVLDLQKYRNSRPAYSLWKPGPWVPHVSRDPEGRLVLTHRRSVDDWPRQLLTASEAWTLLVCDDAQDAWIWISDRWPEERFMVSTTGSLKLIWWKGASGWNALGSSEWTFEHAARQADRHLRDWNDPPPEVDKYWKYHLKDLERWNLIR